VWVQIVGYIARGRGFDSRAVETFVEELNGPAISAVDVRSRKLSNIGDA
jgi:hypothetical protein